METVNSMAQAAAKAVFGDTTTTTQNNETGGREPISGQQGDVTKGEPFDKGNADVSTAGAMGTPLTEDTDPFPGSSTSTAKSSAVDYPHTEPANPFAPSNPAVTGLPHIEPVGSIGDITKPSGSAGGASEPFTSNSAGIEPYGGGAGKESLGSTGASSTELAEPSTGAHPATAKDLGTPQIPKSAGASTEPAESSTGAHPVTAGDVETNTAGSTHPPTEAMRDIKTPPEPTSSTSHHPSAAFAKTTGTAAESSHVPDNDSTNLKAKDTPADTSAAQGDVRDPADPQTNPKNNPTDVDDTGDGPNAGQKLDGPGPQALEDVAKKHGGDAAGGASKPAGGDKPAGEDEDPNGPGVKSHGEGTGEQWVKTTGVHADGGDFDATKPGAGKEADRLLEEMGVHRDGAAPKKDGDESDDDDHAGDKKKKNPLAKLKDKLKH